MSLFMNGDKLTTNLELSEAFGNPNLAYGTMRTRTMEQQTGNSTKAFSSSAPQDQNYSYVVFLLNTTFKKGDKFTVSAISNLSGPQANGYYKVAIYNYDVSINYDDDSDKVFMQAGKYSTRTITVNADSDPNKPPIVLIYPGIAGKTAGNTITTKNLKVEKGATATLWTPAPQDLGLVLQSDFDALKAKVDQLTKNQNGGVTSLLSHIRQGLSNVASNRMEVA